MQRELLACDAEESLETGRKEKTLSGSFVDTASLNSKPNKHLGVCLQILMLYARLNTQTLRRGIYTGWGRGLESQVLMLCAPGLWLEAVFLLN